MISFKFPAVDWITDGRETSATAVYGRTNSVITAFRYSHGSGVGRQRERRRMGCTLLNIVYHNVEHRAGVGGLKRGSAEGIKCTQAFTL